MTAAAAANAGSSSPVSVTATQLWSAWAQYITTTTSGLSSLSWSTLYTGPSAGFAAAALPADLAPGTIYVLRVATQSSLGWSPQFVGRPFQTKAAAPASAPALALTATSASLASVWAVDSSLAGASVAWPAIGANTGAASGAAALRTQLEVRVDAAAASTTVALPSDAGFCPVTALSESASSSPSPDYWSLASAQYPVPWTADVGTAWTAGAALYWPNGGAPAGGAIANNATALSGGTATCQSLLPALSAAASASLGATAQAPTSLLSPSFALSSTALPNTARWAPLCESSQAMSGVALAGACNMLALPPGATMSVRARQQWVASSASSSSPAFGAYSSSDLQATVATAAAPALAPSALTLTVPDPFVLPGGDAPSSAAPLSSFTAVASAQASALTLRRVSHSIQLDYIKFAMHFHRTRPICFESNVKMMSHHLF
jgi:hypothetical protein